ncbi:DUF4129 domain-containing protein [Hymenobacter guriensis]|uniref:DUF4129 domain-containing protein n=1 Tax=Hymenobacter guriensis TaxID=2793065 RepID=A0ABS0L5H3_9BACT|nr:DUF4129 domain-containing protein [Hymenobacter guriensis]MBG8555380.1 DUF4129 domain-containing protein [Hymenobacter guriensis]
MACIFIENNRLVTYCLRFLYASLSWLRTLLSHLERPGRRLQLPRQPWLLALLLLLAAPAFAAPAPASQAATRATYRPPDTERLRELRGQREFQYVDVRSEQSGWDLFWRRFWEWLGELLNTRGGRLTWKYGIYALLVGALVFVVLKLLQVDVTRAFGRAPRTGLLAYDVANEDLETINFDAAIAEAERQENYRVAVRLGYLLALKQLADKGLIRLQPEKTNHDYLYELPEGTLPPAFRELTRQFEFVWYGEHDDLTASQYQQTRSTRLRFLQTLSATRNAA